MASPIHIFFSFGPRGCARVNNTKQPWQKETLLCQWVLWMSSLISNACVLHKCYKQAEKLSYRNTSWKMFNSTRVFFFFFSVAQRNEKSHLLCISHSFAPILISHTHTNPSPPPLTIFQSSACTEVTPMWWAYRDTTEEPARRSKTLTLNHSTDEQTLLLIYWEPRQCN